MYPKKYYLVSITSVMYHNIQEEQKIPWIQSLFCLRFCSLNLWSYGLEGIYDSIKWVPHMEAST